jgi:hypothetical protein
MHFFNIFLNTFQYRTKISCNISSYPSQKCSYTFRNSGFQKKIQQYRPEAQRSADVLIYCSRGITVTNMSDTRNGATNFTLGNFSSVLERAVLAGWPLNNSLTTDWYIPTLAVLFSFSSVSCSHSSRSKFPAVPPPPSLTLL